MASIRTSIELYDQMSGPLNNITNALNMTVNSFGDMDSAMNSSFDSSSLDSARDYLNQANAELQSMEDNIRQADNQQQNLNDSLQEGTGFASGLGKKILGFVGAYAGLQGAKKTIGLSDEFTKKT